jgi:hypothetical protein
MPIGIIAKVMTGNLRNCRLLHCRRLNAVDPFVPHAGRRQQHVFDGENDDQHDAEPIIRQADADYGRPGHHAINPTPDKGTGNSAHYIAGKKGERHCKHRE